MMTALDLALADVYLDEIYRRGLSHTEMQARTGIADRTWRNYFGSRRNNTPPRNTIPPNVLYGVAEAMGAQAWELMRAAQERAATIPQPDGLEAGLTPEGRRVVDEGRAKRAKDAPPRRVKRPRRSA